LESLGIKEHVIAWKQLSDQIKEGLYSEDKSEESIKNFKVILHKITDLTKEVFLSLLYVLCDRRHYFNTGSLRLKLTYETLLEVTNKLELSDNEKQEAEEYLNAIKERVG
jgi:SUMO ligase MMS21 Smc5/6 complex component